MARGSVYKRGRTWYIRYDAGKTQEGGRRQPSEGGFGSQQEAQKVLAQRLHEVASGSYVAATPETFGAYAQYWLESVIGNTVRTHTRRFYGDQVRLHLVPALGKHRLQAMQPHHVYAFYRACEARHMSPQSLRHLHNRLAQIFRSAQRDQLVVRSVMDQVTAPRLPARAVAEMRSWTGPQVGRFLDAMREDRFYTLWHLYAMSGLRCAEALGLRWQDIDPKIPAIHVRQQVIYSRATDGQSTLETSPLLKSDHSYRTVELDGETMRLLEGHRKDQIAQRLADGPSWHDRDLVFPFRHGRCWIPGKISDHWYRRVRLVPDLPTIRLHDLRHAHVSIMLAEGANIRMLAARMGHDPAMMLRTYAHMLPDEQRTAVARFVAALRVREDDARSGRE